MKGRLTHCIFIGVLILAWFVPKTLLAESGITLDSQTITENITWTRVGNPYLLSGAVRVATGVTLSIEPGVEVHFSSNARLSVQGEIRANGTAELPIQFVYEQNGGTSGPSGVIEILGDPSGALGTLATSTLSHVRIEGLSQGIYLDHSQAVLDHVSISHVDVGVYSSWSSVILTDSHIADVNRDGFTMEAGSAQLTSTTVEGVTGGDAISAYIHAQLTLMGVTVKDIGQGSALGIYNSDARVEASFFSDGKDSGVEVYDDEARGPATLSLSHSSIKGFPSYGLYNGTRATIPASGNWWGSNTGPYHPSANPTGKGAAVTDGVNFSPWLTRDPAHPGNSNVLFLPGIQASRLFITESGSENQLWEPNRNADVEALYMDSAGKSLKDNVHTGKIIDSVDSVGVGPNIYKSFSGMMDELVSGGALKRWEAWPYDWRYGADTMASAALADELTFLATTSPTKKVTLVAHSNGGLVAKQLLLSSSALIDKVIFVATPHFGTPQAILSVLHGDALEYGGGLILKKPVGRRLAQYSPGALGLLPSQMYFAQLQAATSSPPSVVHFSSTTDLVSANFFQAYGADIRSADFLRQFLAGEIDHRQTPPFSDTDNPALLEKDQLEQAAQIHRLLDETSIPPEIEVVNISAWGMDTVSGVTYSAKRTCGFLDGEHPNISYFHLCNPRTVLERTPTFSRLGDKTVMLLSADGLGVHDTPAKRLFLDLAAYNRQSARVSRSHADILEMPQLRELLRQSLVPPELSDTSVSLPPFISTTTPLGLRRYLRVSVHSPASIDLFDGRGNHTGISTSTSSSASSTEASVRIDEQVPSSQYMDFGDGKYISFESDAFNGGSVLVRGTGAGLLTLVVEEVVGDEVVRTVTLPDIPVTPLLQISFPVVDFDTAVSSIKAEFGTHFSATLNRDDSFSPATYLSSLREVIRLICMSQRVRLRLLNQLTFFIDTLQVGGNPFPGKALEDLIIVSPDHVDASRALDTPKGRGEFVTAVEELIVKLRAP